MVGEQAPSSPCCCAWCQGLAGAMRRVKAGIPEPKPAGPQQSSRVGGTGQQQLQTEGKSGPMLPAPWEPGAH